MKNWGNYSINQNVDVSGTKKGKILNNIWDTLYFFLPMFLNVVGVNVGVVSVGAPAADEQSICCSLRLSLLFPLFKLFEVMLKSSEKKWRKKFLKTKTDKL